MKKNYYALLIIVFSLLLILNSQIDAKTATGVVFLDENNNGKLDDGENGIKDVCISNQKDVVQTDSKGCFSINIEEEEIIFVIKPKNFSFPLNENNLPQFYYIYQPKGSPEIRYKGVEPTGELPEKIYFPLFASEDLDEFETIIFSDTQTYNSKNIEYMREDTLSELGDTKAKFGMILGDIVSDDLSVFGELNRNIAQIGIPFYNVAGNHDLNHDVKDNQYAYETFKRHYGPPYYSFNYGKVHFVVLADIDWHGKTETTKQFYQGKIDDKQLEWIKNDLKFVDKDNLVVFAMHIPLLTFTSDSNADKIQVKDKLFELIQDRKYLLFLAGHNHTIEHYYLDEKNGWHGSRPLNMIICGTVSGSWYGGPKDERGIPCSTQMDGAPNGYHIFKFVGNKYYQTYKPSSLPADFQIRISAPNNKIAKNEIKDAKIIANVFNGNERCIVQCQIDGLSAQQMNQEIIVDPYFQKLIDENKTTFQNWVGPLKSNHIWTLKIPENLTSGLHKIKVTTILDSGIQYSAFKIFEIE